MSLRLESQPSAKRSYSRLTGVSHGVMAALLGWFVTRDLGLLDLFPLWRGEIKTVFVAAALGAALSFTRTRVLLYVGAASSVIFWFVVAFTPFAAACASSLPVMQTPVKADAVVVLLAHIQENNDFGTPSLERTLHGIGLMQQDFAPQLVLTEGIAPQGSHRVAASQLLKNLKISHPLEVVGPVRDTHDEALAVSRLAKEKGWKRILLVTSPLHSRRSSLVFAKTGVAVVSTPCRETAFNLENLTTPGARIKAFDQAIHEMIGLRVYRARGWI